MRAKARCVSGLPLDYFAQMYFWCVVDTVRFHDKEPLSKIKIPTVDLANSVYSRNITPMVT